MCDVSFFFSLFLSHMFLLDWNLWVLFLPLTRLITLKEIPLDIEQFKSSDASQSLELIV